MRKQRKINSKNPKQVKCQSRTELKFLLLLVLPLDLNLCDAFLEGNKNTFVISIYDRMFLKV